MAPSALPRFGSVALGQGQQAGALGIEHFDATVLGAAGSAGVVRARHVGTDPFRRNWSPFRPLRRKIAATDWARSKLSLSLTALLPVLSVWPSTRIPLCGSAWAILATLPSGLRVIGISMVWRLGLNE